MDPRLSIMEARYMLCTREAGLIDLILTDLVMPKLNSRELAKRLKRLRPSAKVIFMSGYTGGDIEDEGGLAAGAEFIHKPFSPQELAGRVRTVLGAPGRTNHQVHPSEGATAT